MYLAILGYATQRKNKLEEDFYLFLKEQDRTLVDEKDLDHFVKFILDQYDELSKKHHRCKPIKKYSYSDGNEDFCIHCGYVAFSLLKVKSTYHQ